MHDSADSKSEGGKEGGRTLTRERRRRILEALASDQRVLASELATRFGVSESVSTHRVGPCPPGAWLRPLLGGWFLLVLFLQASCAAGSPPGSLLLGYRHHSPPPAPKERVAATAEPGLESATVYVVDFMEPGAVATRPVPLPRAEFQQAFPRLARDVRLGAKTPRQAAHELLSLVATKPDDPWVTMTGYWEVEQHTRAAPTWSRSRSSPQGEVPEVVCVPGRRRLPGPAGRRALPARR